MTEPVILTNIDSGPRGIESAAGLVMIAAGADARIELARGEIEAAAATGWFAVAVSDAPRTRGRGAR